MRVIVCDIASTNAYFDTRIDTPGDHVQFNRFSSELRARICAEDIGAQQRAVSDYLTLLFACNPGVRNDVLNSTENYSKIFLIFAQPLKLDRIWTEIFVH